MKPDTFQRPAWPGPFVGYDAGAPKVDGASVGARPGHRRSAGFALGDAGILNIDLVGDLRTVTRL